MGAPSLSHEAHPSHSGTPKPSVTGSVGGTRNLCRSLPVLPGGPPAPGHPVCVQGVFGVAAAATRGLGPAPRPRPSRFPPRGRSSRGGHHLPTSRRVLRHLWGRIVGRGAEVRASASPRRVRLWLQQVLGVPQEDHHDCDVVM